MTRTFLALAAALVAFAAAAADLRPWSGGATPALALEDLEGKTHRLADSVSNPWVHL